MREISQSLPQTSEFVAFEGVPARTSLAAGRIRSGHQDKCAGRFLLAEHLHGTRCPKDSRSWLQQEASNDHKQFVGEAGADRGAPRPPLPSEPPLQAEKQGGNGPPNPCKARGKEGAQEIQSPFRILNKNNPKRAVH